jgi:hypothetical protein
MQWRMELLQTLTFDPIGESGGPAPRYAGLFPETLTIA